MAKYKSVFHCGELSRQADDKQEFQRKRKREIGAFKKRSAKIGRDLKEREAAFSRGTSSLNKHVE